MNERIKSVTTSFPIIQTRQNGLKQVKCAINFAEPVWTLNHFSPVFYFYTLTPEDIRKQKAFWHIQGRIEMGPWIKICQLDISSIWLVPRNNTCVKQLEFYNIFFILNNFRTTMCRIGCYLYDNIHTLTHYCPIVPFYSPYKHQKPK